MFDYILGLPMHALVIHAVVVLVPLGSLIALAYAARPVWRPVLRWPLAAGGVISGVTAFVAAESGEALERRVIAVRQSTTNLQLLAEHTEWGGRARIVCLVFMVVCLVAAFLVRGRTSTPATTGSSTRSPNRSSTRLTETASPASRSAVELPLVVLLAVAALAALVVVAITGHAGAVVTWNGLG
ncbi:MAG: hypothetical protein JWP82_2766 [Humibacillus sp.]|nr:hypothetical protein [Humibacillus sp.]